MYDGVIPLELLSKKLHSVVLGVCAGAVKNKGRTLRFPCTRIIYS